MTFLEITDERAKWLILAGFLLVIFGPGLIVSVRSMRAQRRRHARRPAPHGLEALHAQGVDTLRPRRTPVTWEPTDHPLDVASPPSDYCRRCGALETTPADELSPGLPLRCPACGAPPAQRYAPAEPWLEDRHRWHPGSPPIDRRALAWREGGLLPQEAYRNRVLPPERPDDNPPTLHDLRTSEQRFGDR